MFFASQFLRQQHKLALEIQVAGGALAVLDINAGGKKFAIHQEGVDAF